MAGPGPYFLGRPRQTARGSALPGFVGADAATLCARMAADAAAPVAGAVIRPATSPTSR
jgi:putative flavoprotein involved in K+ transport